MVKLNITIETASLEYLKEKYTSVQYKSQRTTKCKDLDSKLFEKLKEKS